MKHEQIARIAYVIWQDRMRQNKPGDDKSDWYEAIKVLEDHYAKSESEI